MTKVIFGSKSKMFTSSGQGICCNECSLLKQEAEICIVDRIENFGFPEGSVRTRGKRKKILYVVHKVFVFCNRYVCTDYLLGTNARDNAD
jgi:hypothetical protein